MGGVWNEGVTQIEWGGKEAIGKIGVYLKRHLKRVGCLKAEDRG